ncbi:MAG: M20/M25/M40 family metallo-hydrolase [Desulfobulbaceae bacterium]|nr:M20/M25/M40 family metallo-hydrolase [Desulfobulbaceae bacterium]MCK5545203.1 M20/M25/M40 family metallo-hydrolase [Desulfobulbaceae bacterium]
MINSDRLADLFVALCEIDGPSRHEGRVARFVESLIFEELSPVEFIEDDSASKTGSECGNLIIRFDGGLAGSPIFFNAHLDTVEPASGVRVQRKGDTFFSHGRTVLGADDRSGIAILVEVIRALRDHNIPFRPVDLIFTTCEEVGLLGAKALDPDLIRGRFGYSLDSTGVDRVVVGAPSANNIRVEISGVSAHSGLNPEEGISAIVIASKAISNMVLGRIDEETTANIGIISGGTATNIVPDHVTVQGEVRSHSEEKLEANTREIESKFLNALNSVTLSPGKGHLPPKVIFCSDRQFPAFRLSESEETLVLVQRAASVLSRDIEFVVAGGGSDANIFNGYGLSTAIISTGMTKVHTTDEFIHLHDMARTSELIFTILTS